MTPAEPIRRRKKRPSEGASTPDQQPSGLPPVVLPTESAQPSQPIDDQAAIGPISGEHVNPGSEVDIYAPPVPEPKKIDPEHAMFRPEEAFPTWAQIYQAVLDEYVEVARNYEGGSVALSQVKPYFDLVSRVIGAHPELKVAPVNIPEVVEALRVYQFGYKNLESYMRIDGLEELYFNRFDEGFYIVQGVKTKITDPVFANEQELRDFVDHVARENQLEINDSKPNLDATLKDGSRLNATLDPPAVDGPDFVIRKHRDIPFSLPQYVDGGMISTELVEDLERWVEMGFNIVVSGGTGSGKTTFLNTIGNAMIPKSDRVIILENTKELRIETDDCKYYQTREDATREGGDNEIKIQDLIKYSQRKFPDRIIVGEVRGSEAYHALKAWNSGHDGSFCTVHSDTPQGAIMKLVQLSRGANELDQDGIRELIAGSVDIVVQVKRFKKTATSMQRRQVVAVSQVFHPYKYDLSDDDLQAKLDSMTPRDGLIEMYPGLSLLHLYKLNKDKHLVKINDSIPIEGKDI